jgi:hypothetical protein
MTILLEVLCVAAAVAFCVVVWCAGRAAGGSGCGGLRSLES